MLEAGLEEAQAAIHEARIFLNDKQAAFSKYKVQKVKAKATQVLGQLQQQLQKAQQKLVPRPVAAGSEGGMSAPESGTRRRALLHPASELEREPARGTLRSPRRVPDEEALGHDDPMVSTHDELKSLVAKELGKFLAAHVTKCVHKQSQDLYPSSAANKWSA